MTDLVKTEQVNAVQLYDTPENVNVMLREIRKAAMAVERDTETATGRKKIASTANKVARLKVHLDGLGKDLVSGWKEQSKKVDAERKRLRDELDALKAEVRQPLTVWEDAEKQRVADIHNRIAAISAAAACEDAQPTSKTWTERLNRVKAIAIDDSFAEFANEAAQAKDAAVATIEAELAAAQKTESERAELERLRKEQVEREQREHEERIKQAAAEQARKAAEEAAAKERARVEREKAEAIAAKERAELEAELAAKREREKVEQERKAAEEAEAKRKADERHASTVNQRAAQAIASVGDIGMDAATAIVTAIAAGDIPATSISY